MKFTREMYKNIKKYDRNQMENFCKNIYQAGFHDGAEAGEKADIKMELVQILNNTKGVGPKLFDRIMDTARKRSQADGR